MATLSSARSTLLALHADLLRSQRARSAALALDPQADVTSLDATIASLSSQITAQRATVRSLSASAVAAANTAYVPIVSSTAYDASPTPNSTNAVQSGGVFNDLAAKQDLITATTDVIVGGNVTLGTLTADTLASSANVVGTLATGFQQQITSVGALDSLTCSGNLEVGQDILRVAFLSNRVGVGKVAPLQTLDVEGDLRLHEGLRVAGQTVLGPSSLASTVVQSSLQTFGNLSGVTIAGNLTHANGTAAFRDLLAPNVAVSGAVTATGIRDSFISVIGNRNGDQNFYGPPPSSQVGGAAVAWNRSGGNRETSILNNDLQGNGFVFRQRSGAATNNRLGAITTQGIEFGETGPGVVFIKYSLGTNVLMDTNYSVEWWHPCVVQWRFGPGNISEDAPAPGASIMRLYFTPVDGLWRLVADFASETPHESTWVVVMMTSKWLTNQTPASFDLTD
jgi:hypothetical protein